MKKLNRILLILAFCAGASTALAEDQLVRSATIAYSFDDESFQRLLQAEPLHYVLIQGSLGQTNNTFQDRIQELARAGKRVVLQIWYGPESWGYESWAHFAHDEKLRDKFIRERLDPMLNQYKESVYGVHLLEETGIQFGIDSIGHTDVADPFQNDPAIKQDSYGQRGYADFGGFHGGPQIPNLLHYNDLFQKETSLDMREHEQWGLTEQYVFDRWVSRRIQVAGQKAILAHIKKTYPQLKLFVWDFPFMEGEVVRTQIADYVDLVDGFITDPYLMGYGIFGTIRYFRTLAPTKEIIAILWGGHCDDRTKQARLTTAYLAGADVIGFFESPSGMDFQTPQYLEQNLKLHCVMTALPVFRKNARVLLVGDHTLRAGWAWLRLKYYDFVSRWESRFVDLSHYDVVIIHSSGGYGTSEILWQDDHMKKKYGTESLLDPKQLEEFVQKGGLLVLSGLFDIDEASGFFLNRYLTTTYAPHIRPNLVIPEKEDPKFWLDKVGFKGSYYFPILDVPVHAKSPQVHRGAGYYVEHGKGAVWFYPAIFAEDNPSRGPGADVVKTYQQFLTDGLRALCKYRGLDQVAAEYLPAPEEKGAYLFAHDAARVVTAAVHHFAGLCQKDPNNVNNEPALMDSTDYLMEGTDLWTGRDGVKLSHERPAVIVRHTKEQK